MLGIKIYRSITLVCSLKSFVTIFCAVYIYIDNILEYIMKLLKN